MHNFRDMLKRNDKIWMVFMILGSALLLFPSCYKNFLPKEKDHFSRDVSFDRTEFDVILGRTNVFLHTFNPDYSTQPLHFEMSNFRKAEIKYLTTDSSEYKVDTVPAPELTQEIETLEWREFYSGKEKSIAEIDAKRFKRNRPVLYMRRYSGDLFFFKTDKSVVKPGTYFFDVKVENGGGERVFHMVLNIRRAHPYDPYEFDDRTGERLPKKQGGIIHPNSLSGVVDKDGESIPVDSVNIYFHKVGNPRNTITIKFFDKDSLPIPLSKFNRMKWDSLTYKTEMNDVKVPFGFNRRMSPDSTEVTWDIPNPFPVLTDVSGSAVKASINFKYNRVSFGRRVNANIGFDFSINEPGQWVLIYKFKTNPKFEND